MTEKNSFACKLFFVFIYFRFEYFYVKIATPPPVKPPPFWKFGWRFNPPAIFYMSLKKNQIMNIVFLFNIIYCALKHVRPGSEIQQTSSKPLTLAAMLL